MNFSKKNDKQHPALKLMVNKITLLILLFTINIIGVTAQIEIPPRDTSNDKALGKYFEENRKKPSLEEAIKDLQIIKGTLIAPNGKHYFFTKKRYFRYSKDHGLEKIANIAPNWKGIPDEIDGVFLNVINKKAYFFKGSKYNRWSFEKGLDNKEHPISKFWKGVPNDIDAVTNHTNGKIYFFKDDKYYRYDSKLKKVDKIASISKNWKGVPNYVSAAFLHENGRIYFFKDKKYYRYNIKSGRVDKTATVGKDGWKELNFNKANFTKKIVKAVKKGPGIDAALYNTTHNDVHFINGRNAKYFPLPSGTTLVGQSNRVETNGMLNDEMRTNPMGQKWYTGAPQNVDAATPLVISPRHTKYLFFKGKYVYFWHPGNKEKLKAYDIKKEISSRIPYNLDAAVADEAHRTTVASTLYLFKDEKYYMLEFRSGKFTYKKSGKITDKFTYAPINLDAARWDYESNKIIFYRENKYYTWREVGTLPDKLIK